MHFYKLLILLVISLSFFCLSAANDAVLKLCVFSEGNTFQLSSTDPSAAETLGFKEFKDTGIYIRNFNITVDGAVHPYFKPTKKNENCIMINKIAPGRHTVSIDLKSVSYTTFEPAAPYVTTFKPALLYEGKTNIIHGETAKIEITQQEDRIELYQSLDNAPVPDCKKGCSVPTGIPVYFMQKPQDERTECMVKYQLIFDNEKEKGRSCYKKEAIQKMLENYVKENKILCKPLVEYALFKVYGEGCLVSIAADPEGIGAMPPEIKMIPLEKQKIKYFIKAGDSKKLYSFSGDRKGHEIVPEKGDIIEFIEERENK